MSRRRRKSAVAQRPPGCPCAFTLVELLVVVAIIGVLIAILLPSINGVRQQAKRIRCASNLKDIGIGMQSYIQANNDHLPFASWLPSHSAWPVGAEGPGLGFGSPGGQQTPSPSPSPTPAPVVEPVYLADLMTEHVGNNPAVFECPQDQPGVTERKEPNVGKSYIESERSSYELRGPGPPFWRGIAGMQYDRLAGEFERFRSRKVPNHMIWIMRDWDNFHARAGQSGSRRYLYMDGHVSDYEN